MAESEPSDETTPTASPRGSSSEVTTVTLMNTPIVALKIDGKERLCLAQISNTLLKQFSYNEIHNRRVALGITCVQCTPVQLEILRRAGAMPISSRRCGMITKREAERLCRSFLCDETPPKLPEDFAFEVVHNCSWGCAGSFLPSRYNSSRAKCIRCSYCQVFFSPNKFIFHCHRLPTSTYVQPDAANFNSWRRHLRLAESGTNDYTTMLWEEVKAMFNGGSRKRMLSMAQPSSQMQSSWETRWGSEKALSLQTNPDLSGAAAQKYPKVEGQGQMLTPAARSQRNNSLPQNVNSMAFNQFLSGIYPTPTGQFPDFGYNPFPFGFIPVPPSIGIFPHAAVPGMLSPAFTQALTTTLTDPSQIASTANLNTALGSSPYSAASLVQSMYPGHSSITIEQAPVNDCSKTALAHSSDSKNSESKNPTENSQSKGQPEPPPRLPTESECRENLVPGSSAASLDQKRPISCNSGSSETEEYVSKVPNTSQDEEYSRSASESSETSTMSAQNSAANQTANPEFLPKSSTNQTAANDLLKISATNQTERTEPLDNETEQSDAQINQSACGDVTEGQNGSIMAVERGVADKAKMDEERLIVKLVNEMASGTNSTAMDSKEPEKSSQDQQDDNPGRLEEMDHEKLQKLVQKEREARKKMEEDLLIVKKTLMQALLDKTTKA